MVAVREEPGVRVDMGEQAVVVVDREAHAPTALVGPDEFCRRMHPKLVGALRLYLGEREVAEELAQDALVRVIERWPRVSAMEQPEAWTYRVAFNLARSGLRRRLAERRAHDRNGRPSEESRPHEVADDVAVRDAVAALPPRQREAVLLRYFGDLPLAAVADAMGCRTGTVKAHLHQAVAALRGSGLADDDDLDLQEDPR